ncbi:hypothetical protein VTG60DRAFT_3708 [Thermothelomyces hinnuleus]
MSGSRDLSSGPTSLNWTTATPCTRPSLFVATYQIVWRAISRAIMTMSSEGRSWCPTRKTPFSLTRHLHRACASHRGVGEGTCLCSEDCETRPNGMVRCYSLLGNSSNPHQATANSMKPGIFSNPSPPSSPLSGRLGRPRRPDLWNLDGQSSPFRPPLPSPPILAHPSLGRDRGEWVSRASGC